MGKARDGSSSSSSSTSESNSTISTDEPRGTDNDPASGGGPPGSGGPSGSGGPPGGGYSGGGGGGGGGPPEGSSGGTYDPRRLYPPTKPEPGSYAATAHRDFEPGPGQTQEYYTLTSQEQREIMQVRKSALYAFETVVSGTENYFDGNTVSHEVVGLRALIFLQASAQILQNQIEMYSGDNTYIPERLYVKIMMHKLLRVW